MLWRSHVEPVEVPGPIALGPWSGAALDGSSWTMPADAILIGGAGMGSFRDREIWRRLLAADFPDLVPIEVVFGGAEGWRDAVPRSRWGTFYLLKSDPPLHEPRDEGWAMVVRGGLGQLAMIGSPNEEAWDRFKAALA